MMKKWIPLLLFLCLLAALMPAAAEETPRTDLVFRDGRAQPILTYTSARDSSYTNEGSDILRFCVYVETDYDTDGDGRADLVGTTICSTELTAMKSAPCSSPIPSTSAARPWRSVSPWRKGLHRNNTHRL